MGKDDFERWLESVLRVHFDPEGGAPYWLEKARERGISPLNEIRSLKDLALFGPMDEEALKGRPIEDFVPRCLWVRKSEWVTGETGGTTGRPITTVYLDEEFHRAFVYPFEVVSRYRNFPRGQNWLWIGPSGPHIIGKAAIACAKALGSPDPFAVDFDPRWVKKLSPRSIGFKRYFDHVLEQAMRIVETQVIGVLFSTPKVLCELKSLMSWRHREAILGIHFGGMELDRDLFQTVADAFPNAVLISGYGNTLFGMCPEFQGDPRAPLDYFPFGPRLIFQTVPLDSDMAAEAKLKSLCAVGECGQIVFSRLELSFLILNHFERDQGELISPPDCLEGFGLGIRNPHALKTKESEAYVAAGLY